MVPTYGMTETCGGVVYAGRPLAGVEVRAARWGELLVRGPTLMRGYRLDPAASVDVFEPGGWLRTGDGGEVDDDGTVRVQGRIADVIVSGGEKIWPAEVEASYREPPRGRGGAGIGQPPIASGVSVLSPAWSPQTRGATDARVAARSRGRDHRPPQAASRADHRRAPGPDIARQDPAALSPQRADARCTARSRIRSRVDTIRWGRRAQACRGAPGRSRQRGDRPRPGTPRTASGTRSIGVNAGRPCAAASTCASRSSRCAMYSSMSAPASSTRSPCPGRIVSGCNALTRAQRRHVVGHVALTGVNDRRGAIEDVVARVERSLGGIEEAQMVTRVPRRVHGDQLEIVDARHVPVGHRLRVLVACGGVETVHGRARLLGEPAGERTVIGVRMGEQDRGDATAACARPRRESRRGAGRRRDRGRCRRATSRRRRYVLVPRPVNTDGLGASTRVGGALMTAAPASMLEPHPAGDDLGCYLGLLQRVGAQRGQDRIDGSEPRERVAHHPGGRHDRREIEVEHRSRAGASRPRPPPRHARPPSGRRRRPTAKKRVS